MTLAWFHPAPTVAAEPGWTDLLTAALSSRHEIVHIDAAAACGVIPACARGDFDLCVYEIAETPAHAFIPPYALHVPGVIALHASRLRDRRLASSLIVVPDEMLAAQIHDDTGADTRVAPTGVEAAPGAPGAGGPEQPDAPLRLHVGSTRRGAQHDSIRRAADRAAAAGAHVSFVDEIAAANVVLALEWPPSGGPPLTALQGMAAGRPVVTLETEATAVWAALDPQTWQPRGIEPGPPVVVALDPRDQEHSLLLALRRLSADARLRQALARDGHAWWRAHATPAHARDAWLAILDEAVAMPRRTVPGLADGTARARAILDDIGASVDFL